MKKFFFLFGLCAFHFILHGQDYDSITPRNPRLYMDSLFRLIDSTGISTGVLEEKGLPEIPFRFFSGSADDSTLDYNRWDQLYEQAYHGRKNSTWLLPSGEEVLNRIIEHRSNGYIAISTLFFDYNYITNDSLQDYFTDTNDVLYDNPFRTQSPYLQGVCFASSLTRKEKTCGNVKFILPKNLYFSNKAGISLVTFEADFDDGAGWQTVIPGAAIAIDYATAGVKDVRIRMTHSSGVYYSRSQIYVAYKANTISGFGIWSDLGYSKAEAMVLLAPGHTVPYRPIIFVEGFDALESFDLLDLFEIINAGQKYPFTPLPIYKGWLDNIGIIDRATDWGYDFIILDLKGSGGDRIENNAEILRRLIKAVQLHNPADIIVGGASMGGQVARYCLAKMEKDYCEDHKVSLYISYDSPHLGANIPPSIQYLAKKSNEATIGLVGDVREQYRSLYSFAARQMLVSHVENPYGGPSSFYTSFQNELSRLNYPDKCRRIAVCLGNSDNNQANTSIVNAGRWQPIFTSPYAPLMEIFSYNNNSWMYKDIHCFAQAKFWSPDPISKIRISMQVRIGNKVLSRKDIINGARWQISAQNYDNAPGSYLITSRDVADGMNSNGFFSGSVATTHLRDQHCMVPMVSAIDLKCPNCNTMRQNQNISYFLSNHLVPFENIFFYESGDNQGHQWNVPRDASWFILDELQAALGTTPLTANNYMGSTITPTQTYNFGNSYHRHLNGVTVNGKLQVNGNFGTNYGNGLIPVAGSTPYYLSTHSCTSTVVIVHGVMEIGDAASSSHLGTVEFTSNSTLILKNGSTLKINNGSKLIMGFGSQLVFESGATIDLVGSNSVLEIQGELNIAAGASFAPGGNGFVRFSLPASVPAQAINVTGTGTFSISRGHKSFKAMEVTKGYVKASSLTLFKLYKGTVELGTDAYLKIECKTDLQSVNFKSLGSATGHVHKGVQLGAQSVTDITIKHCDFQNAKTGLWRGLGTGTMSISSCNFINCDNGLYTSGNGAVVRYTKMQNCLAGWKAVNMSNPSELRGWCVNSIVDFNGVSGTNFYVYDSKFEDNSTIISSGPFTTTVRCSYFLNNYTSIYCTDEGTLNLSTTQAITRDDNSTAYGGRNRFENTISEDIYLFRAFDLLLNAGYNHFSYASTPPGASIFGTVSNPVYDPGYTMLLDDNYWDFPGGVHTLPPGQFDIRYLPNNNAITPSIKYLSSAPTYCHFGEGSDVIYVEEGIGKTTLTKMADEPTNSRKQNYFVIYPNPSSGLFTISEIGQTDRMSLDLKVRLIDFMGKAINLPIASYSTRSLSFDVSMLAAGMYQVLIEKDGTLVQSQKISVIKP